MQTAILNGFSCGIVRTEEIPLENLDLVRKEWTENGMICWINRYSSLHNLKSLDDEYNKNTPSQ